MKKKFVEAGILLLVLLSFTASAFGCGFGEFLISPGYQIIPQGESDLDSVNVIYCVYRETFYDERDRVPLIEATIVYPQISGGSGAYLIDKLNSYFIENRDSYLDTIITDGYHYAKGDRDASVEGEYEFVKHSYLQTIRVTYNGNGLLSIVYERVEDTGGVRPNVYQSSDCFNLKSGKRLTLTDLLGPGGESIVYSVARRDIYAAEGKPGFMYYKTWKEDVEKLYNPQDFYIAGASVKVFYQPHTIAPFAMGVPEFDISFDDIRMRMKIPQSSFAGVQNEAYEAAIGPIERNAVIFGEIYVLKMLDMEIPKKRDQNEYLFPVTDPRFTRFEELENLLRNTYARDTADELLSNGRYVNVYGSLYGDIRRNEKVNYNVNWREYSFEVKDLTDKSATLEIITTEELPSGTKRITISARMVKENGKWLLEKMIY